MFIFNPFYTKEVAATVAAGIAHLIEHPGDWLSLTISRKVIVSGRQPPLTERLEVFIKPDLKRPPTLLANDVEVVHCLTK